MQSPCRKRAKRLLELLKERQDADTGLTPPILFAIKHLLQLTHRCNLVEVNIDSLAVNRPLTSYRSLLPTFIVSQLEGQQLTEKCSEKVSVPPIAGFVIQSLPSVCGHEDLYPTLFRWYYPPRHRTYYVFAYITHNMPRRTYTLTELLGLRMTRTSGDEVLTLSENPEFGMLRDSPALSRSRN
jgi:hypothetical protein